MGGTTCYELGDRYKLWRCTMCRNAAEWFGPHDMLAVCPHCGAEDLPYRRPVCGAYVVTEIGCERMPWLSPRLEGE